MNNRILRVQEVLRDEVSFILLRELDVPLGTLVTLTRVEASGNLQQAKLYISVIPESETEKVFSQLSRDVFLIQQKLNRRLKMRPVPKIIWVKETKTAEASRIEELLDKDKAQ